MIALGWLYPSSVPVAALVVSGGDLYVGGYFGTAGGKVSAFMARAYLPPLPSLSILRIGPSLMVSWPSAETGDFILEQTGALHSPVGWATNFANITDDGTNRSVVIPAAKEAMLFRLHRP